MSIRRVLLVVIALLVAYVLGTVGLRYYHFKATPLWKHKLGVPLTLEVREDSQYSVQFQTDSNYIKSDLLHAPNWSSHEVDELLRFIEIPFIRDDQAREGESFDAGLTELRLNQFSALLIIAERFNADAPIDEDQRQILIDQLMAGLYQTESFDSFNFAAADVMRSGLADTPGPIRDRLIDIYIHPQNFFGKYGVSVAKNIKRQLKSRGTFILEGETHE